ncbi:hypothetical protein B0H14DRAFT_2616559 [Mycena olivaceomarginata]|nr:hypothetical protein B0H14DRAFT_2616559 [Mycena olivaceomarginata]
MHANIVAAHLYDEFGHSGDYLSQMSFFSIFAMSPLKSRTRTRARRTWTSRQRQGAAQKEHNQQEGVKLGLPADKAINDTYDVLLQKLEDNPAWNPFGDTKSNGSDSEQTTTPQIKVSSRCKETPVALCRRTSANALQLSELSTLIERCSQKA